MHIHREKIGIVQVGFKQEGLTHRSKLDSDPEGAGRHACFAGTCTYMQLLADVSDMWSDDD